MKRNKDTFLEEQEREYLRDQIYLLEKQYQEEIEFWEWFSSQEGKITVEIPEKHEKEEPDNKLPF